MSPFYDIDAQAAKEVERKIGYALTDLEALRSAIKNGSATIGDLTGQANESTNAALTAAETLELN